MCVCMYIYVSRLGIQLNKVQTRRTIKFCHVFHMGGSTGMDNEDDEESGEGPDS